MVVYMNKESEEYHEAKKEFSRREKKRKVEARQTMKENGIALAVSLTTVSALCYIGSRVLIHILKK